MGFAFWLAVPNKNTDRFLLLGLQCYQDMGHHHTVKM